MSNIDTLRAALEALEASEELLHTARHAMFKMRLNGRGSDCSLSHEVRMFALAFSYKHRDGPGALQINGTGEVYKYLKSSGKVWKELTDMVVRLQHERDELNIQEPAAFRHSFDGYGWLYCDDGSGSSWKEMVYPDKEFLFTRKMPTIERLEADDTEGGAL